MWRFPRHLRLASLSLDDIDLIELNEAFTAQSLAIVKQLGIGMGELNVNGNAIVLWYGKRVRWWRAGRGRHLHESDGVARPR